MNSLVCEKELYGGTQKLYRFNNGYGASVIRHSGSYGFTKNLWELAVVIWNADEYHLCYSTPITDYVLGDLDNSEVQDILDRIKGLPKTVKGEKRG